MANPFKHLPFLFLILALICLSLRIWTAMHSDYSHKKNLFPSHLRMDSLFFGVLIAYFYHFQHDAFSKLASKYRTAVFLIGLIAISPAFVFTLEKTPFIYTFGLTLFYLGSGAVLVATLVTPFRSLRILKMFAYIGTFSYSIYLWHMPVKKWLMPLLNISGNEFGIINFATYLGISIIIGIAMGQLVEFPILKLRDKWFPSKSAALSSVPGEVPK